MGGRGAKATRIRICRARWGLTLLLGCCTLLARGGGSTDPILRVRVRGVAGGMSPQVIEDLNANEMVDDYTYRLFTAP